MQLVFLCFLWDSLSVFSIQVPIVENDCRAVLASTWRNACQFRHSYGPNCPQSCSGHPPAAAVASLFPVQIVSYWTRFWLQIGFMNGSACIQIAIFPHWNVCRQVLSNVAEENEIRDTSYIILFEFSCYDMLDINYTQENQHKNMSALYFVRCYNIDTRI